MTVYSLNKILTNASSSNTTAAAPVVINDLVAKEKGFPTSIQVKISMYSGASASTPHYSKLKFYDANNTVLLEEGILKYTGYGTTVNRDYDIPIPKGTVRVVHEYKLASFLAGRLNYDGHTRLTLLSVTYDFVEKPKMFETTVIASARSVVTSIHRTIEIVKLAAMKTISSEAAIEIQKLSYSHVEPLHTATVRHALLVTSTKGNKISTIAFTNVKTASSSLIEPIDSSVVVANAARATIVSSINSIKTVVLSEPNVYVETFSAPYRSLLEISKVKEVAVVSVMSAIATSCVLDTDKELIVASFMRAAESSLKTKSLSNKTTESHMKPLATSVGSFKAREIAVASHLSLINSEAVASVGKERAAESHVEIILSHSGLMAKSQADSSVEAITASVGSSKTKEVIATSQVTDIHSESTLPNQYNILVHSHIEAVTSRSFAKLAVIATSFTTAIKTNTHNTASRKPAKRTFTVESSVGSICSKTVLARKIILKSYAEPSFSYSLPSYQFGIVSVVSNITSGAVIERNSIAFETVVDSHVRIIPHNILIESRKLKMRLNELKIRLRIPAEDTTNDELLLVLLDDAIDFVQRTCNQTFDIMPPTAKKAVTQYVAFELNGNGYILSESIAGMSQSFESSEQRDKSLSNILRKSGLIKLRFAGGN